MLTEIRENGVPEGSVEILKLDFASFSSIRKFVNEIIERNIPVQILINAGEFPID